jgi:hypothetical protein
LHNGTVPLRGEERDQADGTGCDAAVAGAQLLCTRRSLSSELNTTSVIIAIH